MFISAVGTLTAFALADFEYFFGEGVLKNNMYLKNISFICIKISVAYIY